MYLFRYGIIDSVLYFEKINLAINGLDFFLLVFSVILIAAAGYSINDYFDLQIDRINMADNVVLGNKIPRRRAMLFHAIFNILAIVIGFYVGYKAGLYKLGFIHIIITLLLWLYSVKYKSQFLSGNIIVSLLSGLVVVVVWAFELYALKSNGEIITVSTQKINFFVLGYGLFAFMVSMIREIIKDIEDMQGDQEEGCGTMPIVIGAKKSNWVIIGLTIASVLLLVFVQVKLIQQDFLIPFLYFCVAVQIPFIYLIVKTYKAKEKEDYRYLSNLTKVIMIAGVLSMQIFSISFI